MKQINHTNTSFGCVQGNDGSKGEKGEVGAGNPGSPGLRGKDVSKSRAQSDSHKKYVSVYLRAHVYVHFASLR